MERLQHAGLNRTFVKDSLYLQRAVSRSLSSNTWQIRKYQQQKWKLPNASSSAAVNDPGEWGDDAAKTQNSGFATGSSKIEGELKNSKKTLQRQVVTGLQMCMLRAKLLTNHLERTQNRPKLNFWYACLNACFYDQVFCNKRVFAVRSCL